MKSDEIAIENAKQLKSYCESQTGCCDCAFTNSEGFLGECKLKEIPCTWEIEE